MASPDAPVEKRPFAALCEALPDGSIPALHIANLYYGEEAADYVLKACYVPSWQDEHGNMHHDEPYAEVVGDKVDDPHWSIRFILVPDYTWYDAEGWENEEATPAIEAYLKANGFGR